MALHTAVAARVALVVLTIVLALASDYALADPPERVARLSYAAGAVSFSPAGEDEWVDAVINRPLIAGDRLWADTESRAELQIGSAVVRMGATTSLAILNLDDRVAQFQLTAGSLNLRVRQLAADEIVEVDTPNLAFSVRQPGEYRIDVDANGDATAVAVQSGYGEAYGEGASYAIDAGQWYRFHGNNLQAPEYASNPPRDDLDRWAYERDRRQDASRSLRYVSPRVIGYADLDEYGSWQTVQGYGNVWMPTRVSSDWAPYRQGHWAWIEPWGWNWVDDEPWGFAPFHYGRWAYFGNRWGWVPGPVTVRPVYAPALVAFAGGDDFRLTVSAGRAAPGIAWFPLAPGEAYRPPYRVSRDYFTSVNVSNTRIDRGSLANLYQSYDSRQRGGNLPPLNVNYSNRQIPGAITAVPQTVFAGSQAVGRAHVPVNRDSLVRLQPLAVAPVTPAPNAVLGAAPLSRDRPPGAVLTRPVIARQAPPPPTPSFAARQPGLAAQPGTVPASPPVATKPAERGGQALPQVRVVPGGGAPLRLPPVQAGTQSAPQGQASTPLPPNTGVPRRAGGPLPQPQMNTPSAAPPASATGQPPQRELQRAPMQLPPVAPQASPAQPTGPGLTPPLPPGATRGAPPGRTSPPAAPVPPPTLQPSPAQVAPPSPAQVAPPPPRLAPPQRAPVEPALAQPLARPPELPRAGPAAPAAAAPPAVVRTPEPARIAPPPLITPAAPTPAAVPPPAAAPQELRRGEPQPVERTRAGPRPEDEKR